MRTNDHAQLQDTQDASKGRARFYTIERLGPKQSLTPEGFLLCEEVAAARIGMMVYGAGELPRLTPGQDGLIHVVREEEALFRPETVASLNGKSFTDNHPDNDVVPDNWKHHELGAIFNPRRGPAGQEDLLLVDVLVKDPRAIERVRDGKIEVSCGYDADYEDLGPGRARQYNIIFNHLALVDEGRCGPRCAIRDQNTVKQQEIDDMKAHDLVQKRRSRVADAVSAALKKLGIKAKDEEMKELGEKVADEIAPELADDTHVHVHLPGQDDLGGKQTPVRTFDDEAIQAHIEQNAQEHAAMAQRIAELEAVIATLGGAAGTGDEAAVAEEQVLEQAALDEVPEELKEQAAKAKDSAYLGDSFRDTLAGAEVLFPGIQLPTYDSVAKPGATMKGICGLRRKALDSAYADPVMKSFIDNSTGKRSFEGKAMTCDATRVLFRSAVAHKMALNNAAATAHTNDSARAGEAVSGRITSVAELNRLNRERRGK